MDCPHINQQASFEPKLNSSVLAEHLGKMRPGIVKELDAPGVMSVRFERAGRAVTTGWGLVMPPVAGHSDLAPSE